MIDRVGHPSAKADDVVRVGWHSVVEQIADIRVGHHGSISLDENSIEVINKISGL